MAGSPKVRSAKDVETERSKSGIRIYDAELALSGAPLEEADPEMEKFQQLLQDYLKSTSTEINLLTRST